MSHRITCPHCAAPLRLPAGLTAAFGYCPRCRGQVPNPGVPQGATGDISDPRVFALDDDLGPESPIRRRWLFRVALLSFLGVFLSGGLSSLLEATNAKYDLDWLDVVIDALGVCTLFGFAALMLPLLLVWLMQERFVRYAAPDGYGRVLFVAFFWMVFSALFGVAAFVLFLVAYLGGMMIVK